MEFSIPIITFLSLFSIPLEHNKMANQRLIVLAIALASICLVSAVNDLEFEAWSAKYQKAYSQEEISQRRANYEVIHPYFIRNEVPRYLTFHRRIPKSSSNV